MVVNHQEVPVSAGQVENYVLLLVLLSVFAGGTLVLLSLLLLFCHRCCMGGRRYSRWVLHLQSDTLCGPDQGLY